MRHSKSKHAHARGNCACALLADIFTRADIFTAVRSPANALLAVQMRWANQQAQAQTFEDYKLHTVE